jgi:hypothetical protein
MTSRAPGVPRDAEELVREIDRAFDYRGDVTVFTNDGRQVVGYLFNRNRDTRDPFIEIFPSDGGPPQRIAYARITRIGFTGKDMAAASSPTSSPDP